MSKAGPDPRAPMGGLGERLRSSVLLLGLSLLRGRGLLLLCLLLLLSLGLALSLSLSLSLGLLLLLGFSKPAGVDGGVGVGVGEWVDVGVVVGGQPEPSVWVMQPQRQGTVYGAAVAVAAVLQCCSIPCTFDSQVLRGKC
jgi:hypothetical protein